MLCLTFHIFGDSYLLRALHLAEKLVGMQSPELVPLCNNLGATNAGLDDMDTAIVHFKRALSILKQVQEYALDALCFCNAMKTTTAHT